MRENRPKDGKAKEAAVDSVATSQLNGMDIKSATEEGSVPLQ